MPRVARRYAVVFAVTWLVSPTPSAPATPQPASPRPASLPLEEQVLAQLRIDSPLMLAHLLAEPAGGVEPAARKLFQAVGLPPHAQEGVDLRRPLVLALLAQNAPVKATSSRKLSPREPPAPDESAEPPPDPAELARQSPVLLLLPVRDGQRFLFSLAQGMSKIGARGAAQAFASRQGPLWVEVRGTEAVIAPSYELLAPASKMLHETLRQKQGDLSFHVALKNLFRHYQSAEQALERFGDLNEGGPSEASTRFALRQVRQLAHYAATADELDLSVTFEPEGATVSARLGAKGPSPWGAFASRQRSGPAWGTELVPPGSVLVYTTHMSPERLQSDLEESLSYMEDVGDPKVHVAGHATSDQTRSALERVMEQLGGPMVYAVWPVAGGGVGLGGAYRITGGGPAARRDTLKLHGLVRAVAADMAARQLDLPLRATSVRVRPEVDHVGNVPIDIVELSVRWPKQRAGERRSFEWLFGKKLILATAAPGDRVVFALGRDAQRRVADMIRISSGQAAPCVNDQPEFAKALAFHGERRVSLSYLPVGGMARFIGGLVQATDPKADPVGLELLSTLRGVGTAIVSTTNVTPGGLEVTSFIPTPALLDMGATGGALWRIAFSPVMNPPAVPPLPVPPPQVTPPAHPSKGQPAGKRSVPSLPWSPRRPGNGLVGPARGA